MCTTSVPRPIYAGLYCLTTHSISTATFNFHTSFQEQREKKLDTIPAHQKFLLFFPKIAVISVTYIQQIRENILSRDTWLKASTAHVYWYIICFLLYPSSILGMFQQWGKETKYESPSAIQHVFTGVSKCNVLHSNRRFVLCGTHVKAMNMDESANGSLSVEFRHLVSLSALFLPCTSGKELRYSLKATQGQLHCCQIYTHSLLP